VPSVDAEALFIEELHDENGSKSAAPVLVRGLYALAHSGVLIGLTSAGVMTTACLLLGGLPPLRLLAMAFCVVTSSYAVDRLADLRRDAHPTRTRTLRRLRALAPASLALFGIAVALGLTSAHPISGFVTLLFPLTVALYVLPWMHRLPELLRPSEFRRIKDIPLVKAFYVAACWALFVPWAAPFFPAPGRQIAWAVIFLLPSLFVTVTACDVRDEAADRAAGILTFPVLLGRARTLKMLRAVQLASMTVSVLLWVTGLASSVVAILALSGLPTFLCLGRLARPEVDAGFYADVVFDLLWVFQPLPAAAVVALTGSWS
jgi:4-hydroxybenzoate polyprenyltransferase